MFCSHDSAIPTDPNGGLTCRTCLKGFKNIGQLAGDLSNQVKALDAVIRGLKAVPLIEFQADLQTGSLTLVVDGVSLVLRGPETETECAEEWRELISRQMREEAEQLAERLNP
jgi:hypothetical protein